MQAHTAGWGFFVVFVDWHSKIYCSELASILIQIPE